MPQPSRRLGRFPPYPLADVPRIKRELRAGGVDVIDLGAGDADLAPPSAVVEALCEAAAEPDMGRYAFQLGLPALREAIASWMERRFGVGLDPFAEILPLIGSKEGLAHLALCFLDAGDVAICPDPGYAPYVGGVVLAGAEAYSVRLEEQHGFLLPLDDIPDAVARRAKLMFLNYPNNPTTAIAPVEYLERAIAFCRHYDILLAFDNAYSEIAFDGYRPPGIFEIPGAKDVAIEFHSFSKTYNMTGWRIGWVAGRSDVLGLLSKVKALVDTGQFLAVQAAARAALEAWESWVPGNVAEFQRRRDAMVRALCAKGFRVDAPRATMYLWPPVPPGCDAGQLARRALVEQGLVVLPGSALGAGGDGFLRIALTQPVVRLEAAAERLAQVLP